MGTSKSFPTPSGGNWTPLKNYISSYLGDGGHVSPSQIIGGTIRAAGFATSLPGSSGNRRSGNGAGSAGGTRGRSVGGRASVGRAVSGLGRFGAAVRDGGLEAGIRTLGLDQLRGKPAAVVLVRIAEHLADGVEGIQGELLVVAMREALYEAAALGGDPNLQDLDGALQVFMGDFGPEGIVELFLAHYVFDRVWSQIESHVDHKTESASAAMAMASAVQGSCRSHVRSCMDEIREAGHFEKIDWFGRDGQRIGQNIASELEARLARLRETD